MATVCLIGNSHVANLKMALPAVQPEFPDVATVFFASDGVSMELEVSSGKLAARAEHARNNMAMTSGTDGDISPIYDAYVLCGLTLSSIRAMRTLRPTVNALQEAGRAKTVTPQDVARGMGPVVRTSLAFDIAAKLRQITNAPIFVIATPLSAYERHADLWRELEARNRVGLLAEAFNLACEAAAEDCAATFIPQPQETIGPIAFTTRPEFYRMPPNDAAVERAHHAHMNVAFGAIVLRDALSRVVNCIGGQTLPKPR